MATILAILYVIVFGIILIYSVSIFYDTLKLRNEWNIIQIESQIITHVGRITNYYTQFARLCLKEQESEEGIKLGRTYLDLSIGFNDNLRNLVNKSTDNLQYLCRGVVEDFDNSMLAWEAYIAAKKIPMTSDMKNTFININGELEAACVKRNKIEELEQKKIMFFFPYKNIKK